jgi:ABC-2 type transport system ATP-binding protein
LSINTQQDPTAQKAATNGHHTGAPDSTGVQPSVVSAVSVAQSGRPASIRAEGLGRIYKVKAEKKGRGQPKTKKTLVALDGVDLEVYQGELFGLLGPNGAGKTTLIKILTTLLAPSSGTAYVAGLDVVKQANEVRRVINMVSGGETSGYGILKVRENLWMFSQFYGISWKDAYERIDEMLKVVELEDKAHALVNSLSTGQRQRMNFCRGFVTDPTVMFLDEPTLGLDVHAARIVRDFTKSWLEKNPDRTILLTTHYMAEADELCDRIAIIDHGKVLACDTPSNLKRMLQEQPVFEFTVAGVTDQTISALGAAPGVVRATGKPNESGSVHTLNLILESEAAIGSVVSTLTAQNSSILSLQKHEPTLEAVFIKLVGRSLSENEQ